LTYLHSFPTRRSSDLPHGVQWMCEARLGDPRRARSLPEIRQQNVLPDMQEAIKQPTLAPEAADGLSAAALRAEAWAGEPFLHPRSEEHTSELQSRSEL